MVPSQRSRIPWVARSQTVLALSRVECDPEHPVAARLLPGPTRLLLRRLR